MSGYLLLSIAVSLHSINDLFISNKGKVNIKDLALIGGSPNPASAWAYCQWIQAEWDT